MRLRWIPILIAAILAEILGIFTLVLIVVIFGPSDQALIQDFAERLGFYVGPISGFLLCLTGGYWVARRSVDAKLSNGLAMGTAAAAIDIMIALLLAAPFHWIFVVSNAGRVIAGALGGFVAAKQRSD